MAIRTNTVKIILLLMFILLSIQPALSYANGNQSNELTLIQGASTVTQNSYRPSITTDVYGAGFQRRGSQELTNLRTKNSKTFRNHDETMTVMTSTYSLHYLQANQWKDIDTTIHKMPDQNGFTEIADQNRFSVKFNRRSQPTVTYQVYDETMTYAAMDNLQTEGVVKDNKITYPNAWVQTDLIYKVNPDDLKMELWLKDASAPKVFQFQVTTNNLEIIQKEDGSIDVVNNKGELFGSIPRLWIRDASSSEKRYDRTRLFIDRYENETILRIELNDEGLQYPIMIDPTTNYFEGPSYFDINPDLEISSIVSLEVHSYDNGSDGLEGSPIDFYLTRQEYGNIYVSNPPPGQDGRSVIYIGRTVMVSNYDAILRVTGAQIMAQHGNSGMVYGGACYYAQCWTVLTYIAHKSTLINHTIPSTMEAGKTYPVTVTYRNDGDEAWTEAGAYRLGAIDDSDPFASGRQVITGGQAIAPGQSYTFSFTMTAPSAVGNYISDWRMVKVGLTWFGPPLSRTIKVVPAIAPPTVSPVKLKIQYDYDAAGRIQSTTWTKLSN
ncbi:MULTISPECIES: NBR1-Ig-like domain-containing protein [unclassified Paenibacillus]|uniref:NBR1-Ig-like domain-containing protein n=1 Tax=unclassified Paenibacillus TaxID=185978 RepID=UPI003639C93C